MMGRSFFSGTVNPPVVPGPAQAWGYTRRTFFDDFSSISTIDVNNTKAPGFNWYVNNAWPNAIQFTGQLLNGSLPATPAANISVANSVMTLNKDVSGFFQGLNTACYAANGNGYIGQVFGGGFFVESKLAFAFSDPGFTPGSGKIATTWGFAIEGFTGSSHYIELDFIEANPQTGPAVTIQQAIHDWSIVGSTGIDTENGSSIDGNQANPPISHGDLSQMHTWGTLWVPASLNGGIGLIKRYFDGSEIVEGAQSYSAGGQPNPVPGNQSPANGQFSIIDSCHLALIIGADATIPIQVDSISVWQLG